MKIDFLNNSCKEPARIEPLFGLCDDEDGGKAYSSIENETKWGATVKNESCQEVVFTPVDKCLIKDEDLIGIGRCDGLLTTRQHLYFVELKNQKDRWISDAVAQLESTIKLFKENHDIGQFKHKKAFACNKKHPHFQEIDNEMKIRFFRERGVRLDVQARILIV